MSILVFTHQLDKWDGLYSDWVEKIPGVKRIIISEDKTINGLKLTRYLKNYASIGEKYVVILEDIIEKNSLTDFDKANLLPMKLKKGVAL